MDTQPDKRIKVMVIFGTRPEVIKLAPVIERLKDSDGFEVISVSTGQHREMLGQALETFNISSDYNLDIMQPGQGVSDVTINSLRGIEDLISIERPGLVLVQGDTTSAFAGCLASFYQKVPVGHIEAGLRTYDKYRPFPEEINRSLITQLADLHFVPTETAWESLRREGIPEDSMFVTGNTVIDALFSVISPGYSLANKELDEICSNGRRIILVTTHRRESFGRPLRDICASVSELAERFTDIEIIFTVHRNPKVYTPVKSLLEGKERIHLTEPMGYADMANLLSRCYMVMTDSGGIQEEAPALAKPVLVLRDVTERPEAVRAGLARVVGTSPRSILAAAEELLTDADTYARMSHGISPYGDGDSSRRIVEAIEYTNGMRLSPPEAFVSKVAAIAVCDEALIAQPVSDELFYKQLDERIERAKRERQRVSVATFNLENTDRQQFAEAIRTITRTLRESDTAVALEGRRLVLVLPGAGEKQAYMATKRIRKSLKDPRHGLENLLNVDVKTYENVEQEK
mgnify:CR=1 FL=1